METRDRYEILTAIVMRQQTLEIQIANNKTLSNERKSELIQRNHEIFKGIVDRLIDGGKK